ncbi:2OG-Fe dioxygenase family protein [Massilia sp. MB5]|uniref:2OG-Fe dioxygenase family protein n=1 Tax=Massilia sp. MB5 TaxID=2919578 RepID=UPI001F0ED523|nr:2OG-Fe dioxygenase family protein [Massilia sp. MB5]UMR29537.1 2OG-Fe dioxygenase family protein [Massilia sp. MB5]
MGEDFEVDKQVLASVFEGGGSDGPGRSRFYGRYLLGPAWTIDMLDLAVGSHAFLSSDYRQGADLNPEQGGALRSYFHLPRSLWNSRLLKELILFDLSFVPLAELWPNARRNPLVVGVHLIRMHAAPGRPALPTPSVPHQDGEPFTCIHLIARHGAQGGVSQVFRNTPVDNVSQRGPLLAELTLRDMFDTMVVWDKEVFHHVTALEAGPEQEQAVRDVLIIDFSPLEECRFNARGQIGIAEGSFRAGLRAAPQQSEEARGASIAA